MNVEMMPTQRRIVSECYEKLGEHFEAFVLIVKLDTKDHQEDSHLSYAGGGYTALGLMRKAEARMAAGTVGHVESEPE